jgi:hypothetical protein
LLEAVARLLAREEREVVLGDLVEARETAWRALLGVLGLVAQREVGLWKGWRSETGTLDDLWDGITR